MTDRCQAEASLNQTHTQIKRAKLLQEQDNPDQEATDIIKGISPNAWRHVNLFGKIEFTEVGPKVDIEALAARYNDPDFWRKSLEKGEDDDPVY